MTSSHRRASNSFRCVPVPSSFLPRFLFLRFYRPLTGLLFRLLRANFFFDRSMIFSRLGNHFFCSLFLFLEIDNFGIAFFFLINILGIVNKILSVPRVFLLLLKDSTIIEIIILYICVLMFAFERFFESNLSYILFI